MTMTSLTLIAATRIYISKTQLYPKSIRCPVSIGKEDTLVFLQEHLIPSTL